MFNTFVYKQMILLSTIIHQVENCFYQTTKLLKNKMPTSNFKQKYQAAA